jgi:hypothetical protein
MLSKFVDAVVEGIKVLIPDAAIGASVGAALRTLLSKAADNAYSLFQSAVEKAGKFAEFITDPEKAPEFFKDCIEKVVKMLGDLGDAVDEMGWAKALAISAATVSPLGVFLKKGGKTALDKLASFIEEKTPTIVSLIRTVTTVVMPALTGVLAAYQILMKGEYKEEASAKKKDDKEKKAPEEKKVAEEGFARRPLSSNRKNPRTVQENQLRFLVRSAVREELEIRNKK